MRGREEREGKEINRVRAKKRDGERGREDG